MLRKVAQKYRTAGVTGLGIKALRKGLVPILGKEDANRVYYRLNRNVRHRSISPPNNQVNTTSTRIGEQDHNVFFGFYDNSPFCPENRRVLLNRVTGSVSRETRRSEPLELCYYDTATEQTVPFGESDTWNWQQGCRLQWFPNTNYNVIYNRTVEGNFGSIIQNVQSGEIIREYNYPIYDVSPDGRYAVSINFARLERLLPDYGYPNFPDETADEATPSGEGIHLLDLDTGAAELILSIEDISKVGGFPAGEHEYVMNFMFGPNSNYFLFLHRYNKNGKFRPTNLFCYDIPRKNIQLLESDGNPSHPTWQSNSKILSTVKTPEKIEKDTVYRVYDVQSGSKTELHIEGVNFDSHPSFSPANNNLIALDTYPDDCGELHLYVLDMDSGNFIEVATFYGPVLEDVRRDLHPRWDRLGEYICVDVPGPNNSRHMELINVST